MPSNISVVKKWLSQYKSLQNDQIEQFAVSILSDIELFNALRQIHLHPDLLPLVCQQLYEFYRSENSKLCTFVMEVLPFLLWAYMQSVVDRDMRVNGTSNILEGCLLGVYNLTIGVMQQHQIETNFRIPSLASTSVFHKGIARPELIDLVRDSVIPQPIFTSVNDVNASNRFLFLASLISTHTSALTIYSKRSRSSFCEFCNRVSSLTQSPRVPLDDDLMVELVMGAYQVMFIDNSAVAKASLYAMHDRAVYDSLTRSLNIINAIINTLETHITLGWHDKELSNLPMVSCGASRRPSCVDASAITNASFKPLKLPDDIPIQDLKENETPSTSQVDLHVSQVEVELKPTNRIVAKLTNRTKKTTEKNISIPIILTPSKSNHNGSNNNNYSHKISTGDDSDCDITGPNFLPLESTVL